MLKTVSSFITQVAQSLKSIATTGVMQITGPSAGTTRTVTIPDADATMARTDAAQSFTGDQTLSTGNLVFGASGKGVKGTTTNNNADTGNVGEYVEAIATTYQNFASSTAWKDMASISLTAGDWDITVIGIFNNNGATWSRFDLATSPNAGDTSAGQVDGSNHVLELFASTITAVVYGSLTIASYRVSLSATTTFYLKAQATYSLGTPRLANGRISARRVR